MKRRHHFFRTVIAFITMFFSLLTTNAKAQNTPTNFSSIIANSFSAVPCIYLSQTTFTGTIHQITKWQVVDVAKAIEKIVIGDYTGNKTGTYKMDKIVSDVTKSILISNLPYQPII